VQSVELPPAYLPVLSEIISSTLNMEAMCSSETSVATLQTTRRHIPEDGTLVLKKAVVKLESTCSRGTFDVSRAVKFDGFIEHSFRFSDKCEVFTALSNHFVKL
jgi:hypothetical protein